VPGPRPRWTLAIGSERGALGMRAWNVTHCAGTRISAECRRKATSGSLTFGWLCGAWCI